MEVKVKLDTPTNGRFLPLPVVSMRKILIFITVSIVLGCQIGYQRNEHRIEHCMSCGHAYGRCGQV